MSLEIEIFLIVIIDDCHEIQHIKMTLMILHHNLERGDLNNIITI